MVDSSAVFTVYPRQWISKTFDTSPFKVRIVSYNVLTDLAIPAGSYSYVSETCLYMKNRHSCIMKEIAHFQADIVAFQEVDSHHYYTWLRADMAALGYSGEHSKRLDDFGMATFYKKSRFTLVKRKDCILHALVETHLQVWAILGNITAMFGEWLIWTQIFYVIFWSQICMPNCLVDCTLEKQARH